MEISEEKIVLIIMSPMIIGYLIIGFLAFIFRKKI